MPIVINLKKIDAKYIPLLFEFFESQAQAAVTVEVWKKNTLYKFSNDEEFVFKNDVFRRESRSKPKEVRYEVISNKDAVGEGSFAKVRLIKGTLALSEKEAHFKKVGKDGKRRIVKIQNHRYQSSSIGNLNLEHKNGSEVPSLAIKKPAFISQKSMLTSYLTMRRFPGKDLWDILNYTRLTTKQRIVLSKGLLYALKTQVKDLGLIHRDIKPENIIVHIDSPMTIHIIDYAFSRRVGDSDKACGTIPYTAPENFYDGIQEIGANSDVYSMGRLIAFIWKVNPIFYRDTADHRYQTPEKKLDGLFYGIADLDVSVKNLIKTILKGMLSNDPTTRLSLEAAITEFARIRESGIIEDAAAASDIPIARSTTRLTFFDSHSSSEKTDRSASDKRGSCPLCCIM